MQVAWEDPDPTNGVLEDFVCTNLEDSLLEDISEDEPSSSNIAVRLAAERRRCKELEEEVSRMKADMKKHPAAPRSAACTIC